MSRILILLYGVVGYAIFFATFLYLIAFIGGSALDGLGLDAIVPRTVDAGGPEASLTTALLVNVGVVLLFAVQHTIMARHAFKRWFTRFVPAPMERTTFMLATCGVFAVMFSQWRPMTDVIWSVDGGLAIVLLSISGAGWGLVLLSTFLIDHFDLFGLRQTWLAFRGKPYTQKPFQERSLYRVVRHPLMLGFLVAFWATPIMTVGHLVLALTYTAYIALAVQIEEKSLIAEHGAAYKEYARRVPQLIPMVKRAPKREAVADIG